MRLRSIIAGLLGLTLGAWLVTGQAETYRWTDAEGVVHFSQFPPPNSQQGVKKVTDTPISTLSGSGTTPAESTPAPSSAAPAAGNAPQPLKEQVPPASKQACDTAHANLAALQSGQRIKVQMPDGSTHWLDDAERATRLKQTQAFLAQRCK